MVLGYKVDALYLKAGFIKRISVHYSAGWKWSSVLNVCLSNSRLLLNVFKRLQPNGLKYKPWRLDLDRFSASRYSGIYSWLVKYQ